MVYGSRPEVAMIGMRVGGSLNQPFTLPGQPKFRICYLKNFLNRSKKCVQEQSSFTFFPHSEKIFFRLESFFTAATYVEQWKFLCRELATVCGQAAHVFENPMLRGNRPYMQAHTADPQALQGAVILQCVMYCILHMLFDNTTHRHKRILT